MKEIEVYICLSFRDLFSFLNVWLDFIFLEFLCSFTIPVCLILFNFVAPVTRKEQVRRLTFHLFHVI